MARNQTQNPPGPSPTAKTSGGTVTTDAASAILPSGSLKKFLLWAGMLIITLFAITAVIRWMQSLAQKSSQTGINNVQKTYVSSDTSYPIHGGPITICKGAWSPTISLKDIFTENIEVGIDEANVDMDWLINGKLKHQAARNSPAYVAFKNIVVQSVAAKVSDHSRANSATLRWTITPHS